MTREELLSNARALYEFNQTSENVKSALEKEFPELRESEDEKIRKNLIELLLDTPAQDIISHHLELSKVLAYLEKQKEQKAIEGVIKNITKNKETATKFLKSAGIMDENGELAEMYRSEQQPVEWSKEDKKIQEELCEYFRQLQLMSDKEFSPSLSIDEILSWLKSLRPQPITYMLDEPLGYDNDLNPIYPPINHWKPSDEQMRAVFDASERNDKLGSVLSTL